MYYGYFYPFNDYNLFLFLSANTCLFIAIFYKINNSSLFDGFYFWLFFLLLFPKKSIVPNLDSILTNAVNLSDSLLINTNFSFYNIVNFFIVISVSYKIFFQSNLNLNKVSKNFFNLFISLFTVSIFANLYYNIYLLSDFAPNILSQFYHTLRIFEGVIFSVLIFISVNKKEHFNKILYLFFLTLVITIIEFYLARFTDIFPNAVKYFALDYRGGFRSFIHSGSITTGVILFYGFIGILGMLNKSMKFIFLLPIIALPIFFTYERSTMLLIFISFFIYSYYMLNRYINVNKISIFLLSIFLILNLLPISNNSSIINSFNDAINYNDVDGSAIKQDGWFTFSSSDDRRGARKRALDVFYYSPIFGSGPGNLENMMASDKVPMKANFYNMAPSEYQFYSDIATAYHPTDPHNFYFRIIAEHGIIGIIFLMSFVYLIVSIIYKNKINNSFNILGYSGLFSILGYCFFQTAPVSFPIIFLFLSMIIFKN